MALTQSLAANNASLWAKDLFPNVKMQSFFYSNGMVGEKANKGIVLENNDFTQKRGGTLNFSMTAKLSGNGVDGDGTLSGEGETITAYNYNCAIEQKRQLVQLVGALDEQKNSYDMRADAKEKAAIWMAEFIDRQGFLKAAGITTTTLTDINGVTYSADALWGNTPNIVPVADEAAGIGSRYVCADTAGLDSLQATDIMTTDIIDKAKRQAERSNNPKIRPIKYKGQNYYCMIMHPDQMFDLKKISGNLSARLADAGVRGDENPIFTGAVGMWNNVLLYSHEFIPYCAASSAFSSGGTAAGAAAYRALFLGADALVIGRAGNQNKNLVEDDSIDWGNKYGAAVRFLGAIDKPYFNGVDYGVICVDTGVTA